MINVVCFVGTGVVTGMITGEVTGVVIDVVTGVVFDVFADAVDNVLKLPTVLCVSDRSIIVIGSVCGLLDVVVKVCDVSVEGFVDFAIDVTSGVVIDRTFVIVIADNVIGDFVIFNSELTGTSIVAADPGVVGVNAAGVVAVDVDAIVVVIVASHVDGVVEIDDVFRGNIVVVGVFLVDVIGVGLVGAVEIVVIDGFDEDAAVNGNDDCSDIIDDAVERFIDDDEVIVEDGVGIIFVDSTKVVVDDFDVAVADDFDEILAVASIG